MSFNLQVKRDLCSTKGKLKPCCQRRLLYGALLFGARVEPEKIRLYSRIKEYVDFLDRLIYRCAGISAHIDPLKNGFRVEIKGEALSKIGRVLPMIYDQGARIDGDFIEKNCCSGAFLKGAFLSCGWINDPQKGYRLEFCTRYESLKEGLLQLLLRLGFFPFIVHRRREEAICFKRADQIEDLLHVMGDTPAAFCMSDAVVERDVRNLVNRKVNCETANIAKTVAAAAAQVSAIERITERLGESGIPSELREIAKVRLENPECSLKELSGILGGGFSRSIINRRLQKLMEMAKE